jgi:hypothetical protein
VIKIIQEKGLDYFSDLASFNQTNEDEDISAARKLTGNL